MNEKEKDEFLRPIVDRLKDGFSGSPDYLSGVNDGAYAIGKELLDTLAGKSYITPADESSIPEH